MLESIDTSSTAKVTKTKVANLLVGIGKLAIENYAQVILDYNEQLTSELKRNLTLIINNLQICSQLKSRILQLEEQRNCKEAAKLGGSLQQQPGNKQLEGYLERKKDKLNQLNEENLELLLQAGKQFATDRLLADREDFSEFYEQISFLTEEQSEISDDFEEITEENIDLNPLNLTELLTASRKEIRRD